MPQELEYGEDYKGRVRILQDECEAALLMCTCKGEVLSFFGFLFFYVFFIFFIFSPFRLPLKEDGGRNARKRMVLLSRAGQQS